MNLELWKLRMRKLRAALQSPIAVTALRRHGVLAAVEHVLVIGSGQALLVDIGANKGQFSLAFRAANPGGIIHAFEPLPDAARTFRNVFEGDELVTLHEAAVGPVAQRMDIHVSRRDDSSSLLPIGTLQTTHFPGTDESHTLSVEVIRLIQAIGGATLPAPALLKIDVQGFELQVLQGCDDLLASFDRVYCECSFLPLYEGQALAPDVIAFLATHGFRLAGVHNTAYASDGSAIQADFLFYRRPSTTSAAPESTG
jgi:FkbM family methyltransferase